MSSCSDYFNLSIVILFLLVGVCILHFESYESANYHKRSIFNLLLLLNFHFLDRLGRLIG